MSEAAAPVETWSGKDRGDENFPVGVLINAKLRPHVHAFYAFARNADDIADNPTLTPDDKIARLDTMEAVLLGNSAAGSPHAAKLRASLGETGVIARHATDLLIAFRRDAVKQRYASWDELLDYCRYSAMPVGRHVLDLHGEDASHVYPASDALCASLQILNHLQDSSKDLAALNRCYLPQDMLEAHGTSVDDLRRQAATPGLLAVNHALLAKTEALNAEAMRLPGAVKNRRLQLEVAVIVNLAKRLTARLRQGDPVARRIKLTRLDVIRAVLLAPFR
jgi:farnesyl-diphosphate farnesyltransferase